MSTDRLVVAKVLDEIAEHLEFKGENPFRVRAFRNAARAVVHLPTGVEEALANGSLAATRGIGPATLAIVREYLDTNRSRYLDELRSVITRKGLGSLPAGSPAQWAEQSFRLAKEGLVAPDTNIDEGYYRRHITVIDERIALAGVRLAASLNRILVTAPPQ